ncbi:hypothetical protein H310_08267 [Aphanomyces invadans]|uniref:RBR-type E3 ubiquitin transferase n=1 Tax=Aphanomyces invadans TaxID=157072 RepID=A0A024U130_9STRA|nr:hypothetical protein H310_08267 [Aphanomyces invadans]ETV99616.1 hypothetical protein H310_08267 [Aphanomyces invadans]|eukprot:XP_008872172.1 hypothetical protein H310_08267 [Aphanomyces invadans]
MATGDALRLGVIAAVVLLVVYILQPSPWTVLAVVCSATIAGVLLGGLVLWIICGLLNFLHEIASAFCLPLRAARDALRAAREAPPVQCIVCLKQVESAAGNATCDHCSMTCCGPCIETYLRTKITHDRQAHLPCPSCPVALSDGTLQRFLSPYLTGKLRELEKTQGKCPKCRGCKCTPNVYSRRRLTCTQCTFSWCIKCSQSFHYFATNGCKASSFRMPRQPKEAQQQLPTCDAPPPPVECVVCLDVVEAAGCATCDRCPMQCCGPCLETYLSMKISQDRTAHLPCPSCGAALRAEILERFLSPSMAASVRELEQNSFKCPKCKEQEFTSTWYSQRRLTCIQCTSSWCIDCSQTYHYFATTRCSDSTFRKWRAKNSVKSCPRCKRFIEKNGGCNHMTCTQCRFEFCWSCMDKWRARHTCKSWFA